MDVGTVNGWKFDHVVPAKEIVERIHAVMPLERIPRNYSSETALRYRYQDGGGEIGLIASVTLPFCGDCSRLRLSPEGSLYTCLFAVEGLDLKTPMRDGATDDELEALIRGLWEKRTDRYSEERTTESKRSEKIEMYYIGG
jgi:GTP 3',8-cyclase